MYILHIRGMKRRHVSSSVGRYGGRKRVGWREKAELQGEVRYLSQRGIARSIPRGVPRYNTGQPRGERSTGTWLAHLEAPSSKTLGGGDALVRAVPRRRGDLAIAALTARRARLPLSFLVVLVVLVDARVIPETGGGTREATACARGLTPGRGPRTNPRPRPHPVRRRRRRPVPHLHLVVVIEHDARIHGCAAPGQRHDRAHRRACPLTRVREGAVRVRVRPGGRVCRAYGSWVVVRRGVARAVWAQRVGRRGARARGDGVQIQIQVQVQVQVQGGGGERWGNAKGEGSACHVSFGTVHWAGIQGRRRCQQDGGCHVRCQLGCWLRWRKRDPI